MRSVLRGRAPARRPFVAAVLGVLGFFASAMPAHGGFILDSFDDVGLPIPWPVERITTGSTTEIESGLLGVLGGIRDTTLRTTGFQAPGLDSVAVTIDPSFGTLDYAASVGADGSLGLVYGSALNALNADFSGEAGIEIEFAAFDLANQASMPTTVTVDDGINVATLTLLISSPGAQHIAFSFSDFVGIGAVNLASVTSVTLDFEADMGTDFRLEQIGTVVPAAGTLALLALGLAVLPVTANRRRA